MKNKTILIPIIMVLVLGIIAFSVYLSRVKFDTTLEFQVRDAVSKEWVWDSTIKIQDRAIRGFYQSDRGPVVYKFTHLKPGNYELEISAPAYQSVNIPVVIKKGVNRIEDPIELAGYEISDLDQFFVFEEKVHGSIVSEIRPVGSDGRAIVNHPCIDMWIGCWISEQLKNGLYVQEPTEERSERGKELFAGKIEWQWDPSPETVFRYSSVIPGSQIISHNAPYLVIDYLLILPDSRKITKKEVDELMSNLPPLQDIESLTTYFDEFKDKLFFYVYTSWNVEGAVQ